MREAASIWAALAGQPLLWLAATLAAYWAADALFRASGRQSYANPVLISIVILAAALMLSRTDYQTYFEGTQFIHFMLGPATVCLALPLYDNLGRIRRALLPVTVALLAGSLTAMVSALVIARAFGLDAALMATLAPKSTTAPVAIALAESLGGLPTLAAVVVMLTGVIGAVLATPLLNLLRVRSFQARGFAVGVAAHGIGTARAFQVNETAGAFAGIGMGLNAVLTAVLAPFVLRLLQ
ncbi:MAG: LrgB family protein [Paracoccus sp. (in: a-proteobacteria)]|nr:LrgB family protein [Paracoccus sp. (in: a-proteobacteria)]